MAIKIDIMMYLVSVTRNQVHTVNIVNQNVLYCEDFLNKFTVCILLVN